MNPLTVRREIIEHDDQAHHPASPFPRRVYRRNAGIYKILANPIRLEILNMLNKNGEMPVEAMLNALGVRKANLSQHLSLLRHTRVVTMRRDGLNIYYSLVDGRIVEPCRILRDLWEG